MASPIQQNSFINNFGNGLQSFASTTRDIVKLTAKTALHCIAVVAHIFGVAVFLSMFLPIGIPAATASLPFFGKLAIALVANILANYFAKLAGVPAQPIINVTINNNSEKSLSAKA